MTLEQAFRSHVISNLKGAQVFNLDTIIKVLKKTNLVIANDIVIDKEHLKVLYDDKTIEFELTWREDGPRKTLVNIE
jgi:hypothetical protein